MGQDLEKSIEHLRFASKNLPRDERPLIFLALAHWLRGEKSESRKFLEQAKERNPKNSFAPVALERMDAGVENPFAEEIPRTR